MATAFKTDTPESVQAPIGRRAAARARLQANATLETTTGVASAVLRNLSCTGAMLEGRHLPKTNRTAILRSGDVEVMGVVVWAEEGRCGLHFFDPLSNEAVVREARKPPAAVADDVPKFEVAGISDVITLDDWLKAKARAQRGSRSFRSFS
jgi:hypothetical protein